MEDDIEADVSEVDDAVERRDEVVSRVSEHAGQIARELAVLQGGDYGQESFSTDAGEWTLKYEAGAIEYLRYAGSGGETYVISTKQPPEPDALATAMADYDAFVEAYNEFVETFDGVLDDVATEFPDVRSAESVVAERDRIVARVREVTNAMAGELHRYEGTEYGEYTARVDGTRWKLKWEDGRTSYLRAGGEGGVYLVSQYGPPSAPDLRSRVEEFPGFVEAFNEHVDELDAELSQVSL